MLALCVIARTVQLEMAAVQTHLESQRRILAVRAALRALAACEWERMHSHTNAAAKRVEEGAGDAARWPSSCTDAAARLREAVAPQIRGELAAALSPRATEWLDVGAAAAAAADAAIAFDWPAVLNQCAAHDAARPSSARPHDVARLFQAALLPLRECAACMTLLGAIEHSPITLHASGFSAKLVAASPSRGGGDGGQRRALRSSSGSSLDELASSSHKVSPLAVARAREALSLPDAISLAETLTGSARTAKLSAYIFAARTILSMCTAIGRRDCSAGYAALGAAAQHSISALHPGACAFVLLSHFYSFSSQI